MTHVPVHPPPRRQLGKSFAGMLIRWRRPLFAVAALLSLLGLVPASRLQYDQAIESFYAPDDPHLRDYLDSKSWFGGDEFVVVAFGDPDLFERDGRLSPAGAARLRDLAARFALVPGVDAASTQHLANVLVLDRFPFLADQRERLMQLSEGILLGEDRQTTAILLRLLAEQDAPVRRGRTIAEIRSIAAGFSLPTYIVGEPVQVHDTFRYVEEDGTVLGWASSALLAVVILLVFRRVRWIILPVLVVEAAIVWTKAVLVVGGFRLSMVSSVLNSLLMVVGTATVVHVIVRYRERRARHGPLAAARATLQELGPAIAWTSVTTAAGFAAQLTSHVTPVQSFGLMMAIGSMVILAATATIVPGVLLFGRQESITEAEGDGRIGRILARLSDWVEHTPGRVAAVAAVVVLASLGGMLRLRVETEYSRNFRSTTPIVQSLDYVETRLGGAGVWEVNFPAPADLDSQFLERVRRLAARLRQLEVAGRPAVTKVVSLADGTDLVPFVPLPVKRALLGQLMPEFERSLYNQERGRMRIILRARERQQAEDRLRAIREVERVAREEFPEARTSGLFVLLTFLVASLLDDQWVSGAVASVAIILLMAVAFRSLRIGLVALVPNLLPIATVLGAMGWLGVPVNIGTAMIASVSLGLTVDSSIHYFTGYRRVRREGLDVPAALRATNRGVGAALVYTNLALIAGFMALTMSHFIPLIYFGVLVSVAMLGGLIGNLLLLPLLIRFLRIE